MEQEQVIKEASLLELKVFTAKKKFIKQIKVKERITTDEADRAVIYGFFDTDAVTVKYLRFASYGILFELDGNLWLAKGDWIGGQAALRHRLVTTQIFIA